jgi:hypothetical protein
MWREAGEDLELLLSAGEQIGQKNPSLQRGNEEQIEQNEKADRGSGWEAAAWDRERRRKAWAERAGVRD